MSSKQFCTAQSGDDCRRTQYFVLQKVKIGIRNIKKKMTRNPALT